MIKGAGRGGGEGVRTVDKSIYSLAVCDLPEIHELWLFRETDENFYTNILLHISSEKQTRTSTQIYCFISLQGNR